MQNERLVSPAPPFAKYAALITGYLLFLASAALVFEIPPLLEEMQGDIALNDVQIGWLQGMFALPAVLLAFYGGSLQDRVDSRSSGIVSGLLLLGGNLLFATADSYWLLLVSRFIVGIGTIGINLVSARMITLWFPRRQRGRAMSVLHTGWPVAAGISYSTFVALGRAVGWRGTVFWVNVFILFALILFIVFAPRDPAGSRQSIHLPSMRRLLHLPKELWFTALSWFGFVAGMISILTFGASYLHETGMDYGSASAIVGLLMWTAIPGSIMAGWLLDRWGSLHLHIFIAGVIASLAILGFAVGLPPLPLMILAGLVASVPPIAIYAMPGILVRPSQIGIAFGLVLTFSNFGNTVGPVITGWITEMTTSYRPGMIAAALILMVSAVAGLSVGRHVLREEQPAQE